MTDPVASFLSDTRTSKTPTAFASLLTTTEAAHFLRLSPRTLERLRVSGDGPLFVKVGPGKRARVLYRSGDLETWLRQFNYQSTSEYARQGRTTD